MKRLQANLRSIVLYLVGLEISGPVSAALANFADLQWAMSVRWWLHLVRDE